MGGRATSSFRDVWTVVPVWICARFPVLKSRHRLGSEKQLTVDLSKPPPWLPPDCALMEGSGNPDVSSGGLGEAFSVFIRCRRNPRAGTSCCSVPRAASPFPGRLGSRACSVLTPSCALCPRAGRGHGPEPGGHMWGDRPAPLSQPLEWENWTPRRKCCQHTRDLP